MEQPQGFVNQQESVSSFDLGWLIGAIDGEGCVGITIRSRRTERVKPTFKPHVQISNCDYSFIERCVRILTVMHIPHYVSFSRNKNPKRRDSWQVCIAGLKRVMKILPLIADHLCGEKREKAVLIMEFCNSRLTRNKHWDYTPREIEVYEHLSSLNKKGRKNTLLNDYTRGTVN